MNPDQHVEALGPSPDLAGQMAALYPKMLRYAHRLRRRWGDAEDIAQSAFLRALINAGQYRDGNLSAWLLTLVHNLHVSETRSAVRRAWHVELDPGLSVPATQETTVFCREALSAIARLKPRMRAVMNLVPCQAGDLVDHRPIGEQLGIPTGTVASRLFRGRAELRKWADGEALQ